CVLHHREHDSGTVQCLEARCRDCDLVRAYRKELLTIGTIALRRSDTCEVSLGLDHSDSRIRNSCSRCVCDISKHCGGAELRPGTKANEIGRSCEDRNGQNNSHVAIGPFQKWISFFSYCELHLAS